MPLALGTILELIVDLFAFSAWTSDSGRVRDPNSKSSRILSIVAIILLALFLGALLILGVQYLQKQ